MRKLIRTQAELDAFCLAVSEDPEVKLIAADCETEMLAEDAVTDSGKWLSWLLDLYGTGVYAGKKHQAYIFHDPTFDYGSLDVLFHSYPLVFHNAPFDVSVLQTHRILTEFDQVDVHDTKLMSYIHDENKNSHSLKDLAKSVLKVKADKIVRLGDVGVRPEFVADTLFSGTPEAKSDYEKELAEWEEKMADYCMDDCEYTYKLFEKFKKEMNEESPDLAKVYYKMEVPFMRCLLDMQRKGIALDHDYLKKLETDVDEKLLELGSSIFKEAGRQFNIGSTKQLQEVFKEKKIDVPPEFVTPKGNVSVNAACMQRLAESGVPLAQYILDYRELTKLQSTYIKAMPKLAINGVLHCSWNQTGAVTGRISSNKPNLQNIPRRDDEFNIRKAFKPREGCKFVISDYSQVELRIMAYYSQDPKLLKTYQENGDIHAETAKVMGCPRNVAKAVNFGLNYGRTAWGLANDRSLGITVQEAETFIAKYFKQFPKVKQFMDASQQMVRKNRYVETVTGRRRRFQGYNKLPFRAGEDATSISDYRKDELFKERDKKNREMERQGGNAIIQGSAADIMKIAMRNMHEKLKPLGAQILLQIHDEVVVECPEAIAEQVKEIVKYEMEHAVTLEGVPLIADPKIADSWEK